MKNPLDRDFSFFTGTGTGSKTTGGESLNYLSRLAEIMFPSFFSLARLSIRKTLNRERQKVQKLEKAVIIESIRSKANDASLAALTDFKGMTVEELTGLRVRLREAGGEYHVVKNTLARIALTGGKHDVIKDEFHDNIGVALAFDDPVAVAKALTEFAKTSKLFELRNSSLDGKEMTPADLAALAKLPGRQQLLAQLLGTMNAVPTNFVSVLANVLRGLLYALKAIEEQKAKA
jgi:large subunit ribosomal protein L10